MCVRNKMYVRSCVSAWVTLRVGSLAAKTIRERLDNKRACVFVSFVEVVHLAVLDHSVHDVRPGNFDPRVHTVLREVLVALVGSGVLLHVLQCFYQLVLALHDLLCNQPVFPDSQLEHLKHLRGVVSFDFAGASSPLDRVRVLDFEVLRLILPRKVDVHASSLVQNHGSLLDELVQLLGGGFTLGHGFGPMGEFISYTLRSTAPAPPSLVLMLVPVCLDGLRRCP